MEPIAGSSAADLKPLKHKIPQKNTGKIHWFFSQKENFVSTMKCVKI